MERLVLYMKPTCGYCQRVNHAAERLGIELEQRDTAANAEHAKALLAAVGRATVPVLRIERDDGDDTWLPESGDIVAWMRERAGAPSPVPGWARYGLDRLWFAGIASVVAGGIQGAPEQAVLFGVGFALLAASWAWRWFDDWTLKPR